MSTPTVGRVPTTPENSPEFIWLKTTPDIPALHTMPASTRSSNIARFFEKMASLTVFLARMVVLAMCAGSNNLQILNPVVASVPVTVMNMTAISQPSQQAMLKGNDPVFVGPSSLGHHRMPWNADAAIILIPHS